MKSLDPRVNRLNISDTQMSPKAPLDQLGTYEVFTQLKEGKPFFHVGAVHAPNNDMAFIFAKEQFSRRQTCTGMFVVETRNVWISQYSEGEDTVYNHVIPPKHATGEMQSFELFHLNKRGKQHEYIGSLEAHSPDEALYLANEEFIDAKPVYNVWIVASEHIKFSSEEDKVIWETLPEKKFRDAIAYKAGDKIKEFKEKEGAL